jgi:hypothetical protein
MKSWSETPNPDLVCLPDHPLRRRSARNGTTAQQLGTPHAAEILWSDSHRTESASLRLWLWKTFRNRLSDPTVDELSHRATRVSSRERREPDRGLDRALDGRPHRRRCGRHMRTECRRDQLAPHPDAHARAAQACASNAPRHKGRRAWSPLSLLNAHELTSFEGSSRCKAS